TATIICCCFLFICALLTGSLGTFCRRENLAIRWGVSLFFVHHPRYLKSKGASTPLRALHAHATAVSGANRFHDREAKAGPAQLTGPGFIRPIKAFENVRLALLRNTNSAIGDGQDRLVSLAAHGDTDRSTVGRVLDGIVEKIHYHLL